MSMVGGEFIMMKTLNRIFSISLFMMIIFSAPSVLAKDTEIDKLILYPSTKKESLYPSLYILADNEKELTINDVTSGQFANQFNQSKHFKQSGGFSDIARWTLIERENQ